jgi:hypothetical protein
MMTGILLSLVLLGARPAPGADFQTRAAGNWHADADNTPGVGIWDVAAGSPANTYPASGDTADFRHRVDVALGYPQTFSGGFIAGVNPVWRLYDNLTLDGGTVTYRSNALAVIESRGKTFINNGSFVHDCNQGLYWDVYTTTNSVFLNNGTFRFTTNGFFQLRQYSTGLAVFLNNGTLLAQGAGNGKMSVGNVANVTVLSNSPSGVIKADGRILQIQVQLNGEGGTLIATNGGVIAFDGTLFFGGHDTPTNTLFTTGSGGSIRLGGRINRFQGVITPGSDVRLAQAVTVTGSVAFLHFTGEPLRLGGPAYINIEPATNQALEFRSPAIFDTNHYFNVRFGIMRNVAGNTIIHDGRTGGTSGDWYIREKAVLENYGTLVFSGNTLYPVRLDGSGSGAATFLNATGATIVIEAGSRTFNLANSNQLFSNQGALELRNGATLTLSSAATLAQWNGTGALTGGAWRLQCSTTNTVLNLDPANAGITTLGPDASVTLSRSGTGTVTFAELTPLNRVEGRLALHDNMRFAATNGLAVPGTLEFGLGDDNLTTPLLVVTGNVNFTGGTVDFTDLGVIEGTYTLASWTGSESGTLSPGSAPTGAEVYQLVQDNTANELRVVVATRRSGAVIQVR